MPYFKISKEAQEEAFQEAYERGYQAGIIKSAKEAIAGYKARGLSYKEVYDELMDLDLDELDSLQIVRLLAEQYDEVMFREDYVKSITAEVSKMIAKEYNMPLELATMKFTLGPVYSYLAYSDNPFFEVGPDVFFELYKKDLEHSIPVMDKAFKQVKKELAEKKGSK